MVLDDYDVPQPDLVVVKPRADAYARHPRAHDVLLIIEVADTSLAYDRDTKIPLYARAGIPEVWLVDLAADRLHVHLAPSGRRYTSVHAVSRGHTITPLHFPNLTLSADEILG